MTMKKKVLIIEDDKDTLEILAYLAEDLHVDFELYPGVLSLSQIKEINPDLVLLDHWVNDGSGGQLCREIKSDPATANLPVVMISAYTGLAQVAKESKADGYLPKPFDIDAVQDIIRKYTRL
jgi:CheY-like chemotaxis protein